MLYPISVSGGAIEDLLRVMVRILAKVLLFVKLYISSVPEVHMSAVKL